MQISYTTPQAAAACDDLAGGGVLLPQPPSPRPSRTFLDYTHVL